jgi:ferredoxin
MTVKANKDICLYCGGCVAVCPVAALQLRETYIKVDGKKCTDCGICIKICPAGAMKRA